MDTLAHTGERGATHDEESIDVASQRRYAVLTTKESDFSDLVMGSSLHQSGDPGHIRLARQLPLRKPVEATA